MPKRLDKNHMRKAIASAIANITHSDRAAYDHLIPEQFHNWFARHTGCSGPGAWYGQTILAYMPLPDEPQITPLLVECLAGKGTLILPRVDRDNTLHLCRITDVDRDLGPGSFGIVEPLASTPTIEESALDLILVPGRAFTVCGNRLGRGKGCYDRLFAKTDALRVALAYDCQIVDSLPVAGHDQEVDVLITPDGAIDCRDERKKR